MVVSCIVVSLTVLGKKSVCNCTIVYHRNLSIELSRGIFTVFVLDYNMYCMFFFCNATLNYAKLEDTATHNICMLQCFKLFFVFSSLYIE